MVVGYYDGQGLPNLIPGSASTQTAEVNAAIADDSQYPSCGQAYTDHYQDYSCPIDYSPNMQTDRSETGGAHADNCIADFMYTSRSANGNYYGWSWYSHVPGSFEDYVNLVAPEYNPISSNLTYSSFPWYMYKAVVRIIL
jgi:hypothetical protein